MKKYFLFVIVSFCFSFAKAQLNDSNAPVMTFDVLDFDNGFIRQGTIIEHEYQFTNTGKTPLLIYTASGSGHSTVVMYPKEPIAPGRKGAVKIRFDTNAKMGWQDKRATIESNNKDGTIVLRLRSYVVIDGEFMLFTKNIINNDTFYAENEKGMQLYHDWPPTECYADFDTVTAGKQVHIRYQFVNPSKSLLVITEAKGSAGSVVPSYDKNPVSPMGTGEIDVVFMTDGSMGMQSKTVTVQYFTSNAEGTITVVLHLKGYVLSQ